MCRSFSEGFAIATYASEWSPEDDASASSIQSTLWSVILRTRDPKDPQRVAALIRLFNAFSTALYAYARRRYPERAEAEAAVRGFLDFIRSAGLGFGPRDQRDRLRAFTLSAFQDYLEIRALRDTWPGAGDAGNATDFEGAEAWLRGEPDMKAEATYQRAWARCVIAQSCTLLSQELAADGGSAAAEMILAEVSPSGVKPFNPDLARKLGVTSAEALEMLRTARRRLRELILETIRETVSAQSEVEVEFWDLFKSV